MFTEFFAQVFLADKLRLPFYDYDRCDRTLRTRWHPRLDIYRLRDAQFFPPNPSVLAVEMEEAASTFYLARSRFHLSIMQLFSPSNLQKWFLEPEFQFEKNHYYIRLLLMMLFGRLTSTTD